MQQRVVTFGRVGRQLTDHIGSVVYAALETGHTHIKLQQIHSRAGCLLGAGIGIR